MGRTFLLNFIWPLTAKPLLVFPLASKQPHYLSNMHRLQGEAFWEPFYGEDSFINYNCAFHLCVQLLRKNKIMPELRGISLELWIQELSWDLEDEEWKVCSQNMHDCEPYAQPDMRLPWFAFTCKSVDEPKRPFHAPFCTYLTLFQI